MTTKKLTFADVWKKLSAIDVSAHIKKVNGMNYLPWGAAWVIMMEHYPQTEFLADDVENTDSGSVTVWVTVKIGDLQRKMFLPVTEGYRHAAKTAPDCRDINDARVRCLTKCLALFGLGIRLYVDGDGLPVSVDKPADGPNVTKPADDPDKQIAEIEGILLSLDETVVDGFLTYYKVSRPADIPHYKLPKAIEQLKIKLKETEAVA